MTDLPLADRNILVTGASRGIGRGCALELARAGANIAINYHSNREAADDTAGEIRDMGRRAIVLQADVADWDSVKNLVARTVEEFGSIEGFVSNAAYSDRQPMLDADMDGFRRTVDVTMWGAFHGVRAAAEALVEIGKGGSIIVISSPHAEIPFPTAMAYNMSKAAIDHMARTAAIELAKHRVRVNIVHPGWIDTPGERKFFTEEQIAEGAKKLPWGRLGRPEEVGRVVRFLMSDEAEYMTGGTTTIDGGVSLPWWSNREDGNL